MHSCPKCGKLFESQKGLNMYIHPKLRIFVDGAENLNSTCFDSYCGRIRFTANGVEVADPLDYVLR
jgi:predicted  nucleic acid-binding Zn-ribbon protein